MTKLRIGGPSAPGAHELRELQAKLKTTLDKEYSLLQFAEHVAGPPSSKGDLLSGPGQKILEAEMKNPRSMIDWGRFAELREGGRAALERAQANFKADCKTESAVIALNRALPRIAYLDSTSEVGTFPPGVAREQYQLRLELLEQVQDIQLMLESSRGSPAANAFPTAQLEALRTQLRLDLEDLAQAHGSAVRKKGPFDWRSGRHAPSAARSKPLDPAPALRLPQRVSLSPAEVTDLKQAAQSLERLLAAPGLGEQVLAFADQQGMAEHQLIKVLGAFTLLADEATTAPDYRYEQGKNLRDRAEYRARKHSKPNWRNSDSRTELKAALKQLMEAKDPVATGEQLVVEHFLREIGFSAAERQEVKATFDAVRSALEEEAFLPLRYLNEFSGTSKYADVKQQMRELFHQVTRAFVEGRYEEWKAQLPANEWQLRSLTPEGRAAWSKPLETEYEIQDKKGAPVILKTHEARGFERLWVTKNHTGSHGFDHPIGTPCLLAYLTNPRTEAIIVEDPRWPQQAGRMYMRLLERPDGRPAMFVEGMAGDSEYPCQNEAEAALLRHAIQKAKAVGAELVISGYASATVELLGLKVEQQERALSRFVLSPTPLIEATVAFGDHDWVHHHESERSPNKDPFLYLDN